MVCGETSYKQQLDKSFFLCTKKKHAELTTLFLSHLAKLCACCVRIAKPAKKE